jgi:ABC-type antimicrobial peptide transport system permease subunit
MKISNAVNIAFKALRRNPMRALLTTLGIIIGIAAVIAMMEIGQGSSAAIKKSISSMGANNLLIFPGTAAASGVRFGSGSGISLSPEDCEAIVKECPALKNAAPIVRARTQMVFGNRNWVPSNINGSTPALLNIQDWTIAEGTVFTERDVLQANRVCLVGQTIIRELLEGEKPIGQEIRLKNVTFKIIGTLAPKGANMVGMDQDDIVIAPWTAIKFRVTGSPLGNTNQSSSTAATNTLNKLYPGNAPTLYPEKSETQQADTMMAIRFINVDYILASAKSPEDIPAAIKQMTAVLRERHHIIGEENDDFNIRDMTEMSKMLTSTTTLMTNLLLCVSMISLIVGGVGIMNIMLVSVTERTREIGLRMAVGARARDILCQFLVESIVLCLIGGIIGIILGHGGSLLIEYFLKWPIQTSPAAITTAVLVSVGIGIGFGFYPAWKASRLDPIEALRYE